MSRLDPQQEAPAADLDLGPFPAAVSVPETVFRAHAKTHGPCYFSNTGAGRFDLAEKRGTMYAADDAETALRESLGPLATSGKTLAGADADRIVISEIPLPGGRYADVSAKTAVRFGVLRELATMLLYQIPQAWAARFDAFGFSGIHYPSRFTTEATANAWAVFGSAGPDDSVTALHQTSGQLACADAGIPVASPTAKNTFRFLTNE